jgi:hypothetical protein
MSLPDAITNNMGHLLFIAYIISISILLFSIFLILVAVKKLHEYNIKTPSIAYSPGFVVLVFSILLITTHMVYK